VQCAEGPWSDTDDPTGVLSRYHRKLDEHPSDHQPDLDDGI